MSKLKVMNAQGAVAGEVDLADSLLELRKGAQAVHDSVTAHLAERRAGTASTLSKGEVAGSNKKPWKQKGTGRARAGLRQSPVWRGGGVAFGPKPRSYGMKVNRKVARLAFRRAFSEKVQAGQVRVIDALSLAEPRTRLFTALLKGMEAERPAIFLVCEADRNVQLAARNVVGVEVVRATDVNVYQLLRARNVVVTRDALDVVKSRLGGKTEVAE